MHAVRTGLGFAATAIFVWASMSWRRGEMVRPWICRILRVVKPQAGGLFGNVDVDRCTGEERGDDECELSGEHHSSSGLRSAPNFAQGHRFSSIALHGARSFTLQHWRGSRRLRRSHTPSRLSSSRDPEDGLPDGERSWRLLCGACRTQFAASDQRLSDLECHR